MNFSQALAQQKARVAAAHAHYCQCRDELQKLIDQLVATDPWDTATIFELSKKIGLAEFEEEQAWQRWDKAIEALSNIPTGDTATMTEWEQAIALMPKGYRVKGGWFYDAFGCRCSNPPIALTQRQLDILTGEIPIETEPVDCFYQSNDEPELLYEEMELHQGR